MMLRDALKALKARLPVDHSWKEAEPGEIVFPDRNTGICGNVTAYFMLSKGSPVEYIAAKNELIDLFKKWPNRRRGVGGDWQRARYPVGGIEEYRHEVIHRTFWNNYRRLALLDWLLENCDGTD